MGFNKPLDDGISLMWPRDRLSMIALNLFALCIENLIAKRRGSGPKLSPIVHVMYDRRVVWQRGELRRNRLFGARYNIVQEAHIPSLERDEHLGYVEVRELIELDIKPLMSIVVQAMMPLQWSKRFAIQANWKRLATEELRSKIYTKPNTSIRGYHRTHDEAREALDTAALLGRPLLEEFSSSG
jgi:hypothetical protein